MSTWMGFRVGVPRVRNLLVTASIFVLAGCGGGAPSDEAVEPTADVTVAAAETEEEPQDTTAGALRRFLPDEMRRSTRAETFAHDAHLDIDCAVCHEVAEGHGSHEDVECADCHRASALATVAAVGPGECQACHHGVEQAFDCAYCHETPGRLASRQELLLEVWSQPRVRALGFEHARHAEVGCSDCHRGAPDLSPAAPCAACHADHHTTDVRCADCHTEPAEGAHDVAAHLTCSGAGCHRDQSVEAMAGTRPVCLSCHQDLEEHEPGGECIDCHQVRGGPRAGAPR